MKKIKGLMTLLFLLSALHSEAQNRLVSLDSTKTPDIELGEVIISASRDESKIKDIPTSITSIRSAQIENNQILSLEDASAFAPNFMMIDYGTKIMSPVYIRGIGSKKNSPSVGMYVDGIPYYDNSALSFDFYDIAQLEILRGPQGTLYGRNTIGGLININTLSPLDYQGTGVRLTAGQYNDYNATVGHYGKTEKLAYSLSANYNYDGGYFTNNYDGSSVDESTSYGLRNRLIYQVNKKLSLENIFSFEQSTQNGYPYALVDSTGKVGDVDYNEPSSYDRLMINEGFIANYEEDKWIATATLSYQYIDDKQVIDQDFTSTPKYIFNQTQTQNMFSAEGVMRSKGETRYKWINGIFAFTNSTDKTLDVDLTSMTYVKEYENSVLSSGIFHQSTFKITDKLSVIGGVRFNYEKSMLDYVYTLNGASTPRADTSYTALEEIIVLPKLAFTYSLDPVTFYTSYATGYKPGGYNSSFESEEQLHFENEMSHNFELGAKGNLFGSYVFYDLALFLSNIEGQQLLRTLPSGQGTYLDNSGRSRNKGIEISVSTQQIAGFSANIAYGFTDTEFITYEKDTSTNYNGNTSPFVPTHTFNATINKTIVTETSEFLDKINMHVSYTHIGQMYWNVENTMKQDGYGTLGAQISFVHKDMSLDFWGKNILDTDYNAYMFSMSGSAYAQKGQPQRFGTTLSLKF